MKGEDVTFKKDGADPITTVALKWVGRVAEALGFCIDPAERARQEMRREINRFNRQNRGKRPQKRPTRKTNMLHVSKRVRRKHRRAHG